jgi:dolichol-phosphate mannosyltransferase
MTQESRSNGRVAVIIPTYNERDNIASVTARIRSVVPEADLLVVDDNSPDMTGQIADELAAADSHIHVLHRQSKAGLGTAYLAGFRWALDHRYGVIVEMDADGSHQPEELPRLLRALKGADLVLGSRWIAGGQVLNWPRSRRILSRAGNVYARCMLGISLKDVTGGYRVYRASVLPMIGLENVQSQGYCFQIDLVRRALGAGLVVIEMPITFMERTRGKSKMSRTIVCEAIWMVTRWGIAERAHKYFRQESLRRGRPFRRRTSPSGFEPAVRAVDGWSP